MCTVRLPLIHLCPCCAVNVAHVPMLRQQFHTYLHETYWCAADRLVISKFHLNKWMNNKNYPRHHCVAPVPELLGQQRFQERKHAVPQTPRLSPI